MAEEKKAVPAKKKAPVKKKEPKEMTLVELNELSRGIPEVMENDRVRTKGPRAYR